VSYEQPERGGQSNKTSLANIDTVMGRGATSGSKLLSSRIKADEEKDGV